MRENIKLILNKKKYNISNIIELDSNNTIYNYPKPKPFNLNLYIHLLSRKIIIYLLLITSLYFIFNF